MACQFCRKVRARVSRALYGYERGGTAEREVVPAPPPLVDEVAKRRAARRAVLEARGAARSREDVQ